MSGKYSVAICTYNGDKYIVQQLQSIVEQTIKPSEIVVCDDKSSDSTVEKILAFEKNCPIPICLIKNQSSLGVRRNFAKAIRCCSYEIIALSDQDDFWMHDKIEKQMALLIDDNVDSVFSNLEIVDENLCSLKTNMWDYLNFSKKYQRIWKEGRAFEVIYGKGNVITGCTVLMKKKFAVKVAQAIERDFFVGNLHDEIIAKIGSANQSVYFVEECLTKYRQHPKQVVGARVNTNNFFSKTVTSFSNLSNLTNTLKKELESLAILGCPQDNLNYLRKKIEHYQIRENLPVKLLPRLITVIREYCRYNYNFSSGYKSALKDILRPIERS